MNKLANPPDPIEETREVEGKGPNLFLLYGLFLLALLGAMAVAAMIVWPFYVRR